MIIRSLENEQLLKNTVSKAIEEIEKGDVLSQISYSQSVSIENNKLQSIDDVSHSILGCRIFQDGKVGNSFVNDPLLYKEMIKNSKESAQFGKEIDIQLPKNKEYQLLSWAYNPKNLEYSKNDLKNIAQELINEIKKFAPQAKISTNIYTGYSQFNLQNTEGFCGEYSESNLYLSGGVFELTSDGSFLEMYEGYSFYDEDINFDKILIPLKKNIEQARQSATFNKNGKFPVIFAPSAMDLLLEPIEIAINGKTLSKGLSLLENRLGEMAFDKKFSMIDDPFYYHGDASVPFDDEGVIGQQLNLINNGIFENFIFDCTTAEKMNMQSTGHASRNASSLPYPALTNKMIGLGDASLDAMINTIDYGLLLLSSLGEGQSNTLAGDFSVLAEMAFLIENGILKGRVKDVMLSGNSFELLKNISMIENKLHKMSSLFTPHILLDHVQISTK